MNKTIIFVVFLTFAVIMGACAGGKWTNISKNIRGKILCMEGLDGDDIVYVGTEKGLYEKEGLSDPVRIDLPGKSSFVRSIAVTPENIYIASSGGLYTKNGKNGWKRVPGSKEISGVVAYNGRDRELIIAWTKNKIFNVIGKAMLNVNPLNLSGVIEDIVISNGRIYVKSGGEIYYSDDSGKLWNRILPFRGNVPEDTISEMLEEVVDAEEIEFLPTSMDSDGSSKIVAISQKSVCLIDNNGCLVRRIDTTGLPSKDVKNVAVSGESIFVSTRREVFLFSEDKSIWIPVFEMESPGEINVIEITNPADGKETLLVASGERLYRADVRTIVEEGPAIDEMNMDEKSSNYKTISIREVHKMAIEYAEVSPDKIKEWRNGARWKAILPKLSLSYSEGYNDNIELYKSSTQYYIAEGPREKDNDWGVDLSWDLSDLVWNDSQTSIDVRSKLMVQLRDDILEEVTRLYFERKKAVDEIRAIPPEEHIKLAEKRLRIEELTAYIDALTGGRYSEELEKRR